MIVYGIKNCNTVKVGLEWLRKNAIAYEFHDYKVRSITTAKLKDWCCQVGWEALVNKRGTTWRQLDEKIKGSITNEDAAIRLMSEKTSIIKRPLLELEGKIVALGFDQKEYEKNLKK